MFATLLLLAASAVGTNYGWEPLEEGGMKYIVQFTPETLAEAQQAGVPVESEIPAAVNDVRSISIRLGSGPLPRKNRKPADSAPKTLAAEAPSSNLPPPVLKGPQGQLLANQASFNEPVAESKSAQETKAAAATSTAGEPSKPWWPLSAVSVLLFASLGGNVYLLWIFAELRKRYRVMLTK